MPPLFRTLVALCVVLLIIACQQPAVGPLEGAWKFNEVSFTSTDTSWTDTDPQPSLYIFLNRHYSTVFVLGSESRDLFSDQPTDAERLAAYDNFIANSGTYEVSDSTLTVRPSVAKVPNGMSGESFRYTYRLEGDTLRLILSEAWAQGAEVRYTLVRVE